jgi:general secretion pathway protein H
MTPSRAAPAGRQPGFTLVEILVVVIVVGIIATAAVLALGAGGTDRQLEREGRRLAALLELASEEAVLQGRELGLELFAAGYRFHAWVPDDDDWRALDEDRHLGPRQLPEGMDLALLLEGRDVTLALEAAADGRPQIMLLSSGELTPFALEFRRNRSPGLLLQADALGRVLIELAEERT